MIEVGRAVGIDGCYVGRVVREKVWETDAWKFVSEYDGKEQFRGGLTITVIPANCCDRGITLL